MPPIRLVNYAPRTGNPQHKRLCHVTPRGNRRASPGSNTSSRTGWWANPEVRCVADVCEAAGSFSRCHIWFRKSYHWRDYWTQTSDAPLLRRSLGHSTDLAVRQNTNSYMETHTYSPKDTRNTWAVSYLKVTISWTNTWNFANQNAK